MIPVTKPYLPAIAKYQSLIEEIWRRDILTNNGPLVQRLEESLRTFLNAEHMLFVTSGTMALQLSIRALNLTGEIITTPFSYVATASSIVWENCIPVFVDIDRDTFNIDPNAIENAVTPRTTAILATHCYGYACDIDSIAEIAERRKLKVIYDAAHAFGTKYKGRSVYLYGDVSAASFHATKLFHTIEGGAIFSNDRDLIVKLKYMRNFGHDGPEKFNGVGINGKNSEFHAAMGLCVLDDIDSVLQRRREQTEYYDGLLRDLPVRRPVALKLCEPNFAYYPIVFESEAQTLRVKENLERHEIFPRRYFYPTLSTLPYVGTSYTPIANDIARRVLCLPMYHELNTDNQSMICDVIIRACEFGEVRK
jgi:dTDP-4-amino-4,6-dideoxygalactose transaminase